MSFLRLPTLASRQTLAALSRPRFAAGGVRLYTGGATRHGNDPEVLERGKQSVLKKHSKDSTEEPHWHEEIASDAEAYVKAEREEIEADGEAIRKLVEKSKKKYEKTTK